MWCDWLGCRRASGIQEVRAQGLGGGGSHISTVQSVKPSLVYSILRIIVYKEKSHMYEIQYPDGVKLADNRIGN